jgi:UDP-N-acetylmuramate dehydrogenase
MNLGLYTYSTFKIGGIAHKVFLLKNITDIIEVDLYASQVSKPLVVLGEGSNSIFADTNDKYIIGLIQNKGIKIIKKNKNNILVKVSAGEIWDEFVKWSVDHSFSGVEALSGIPGTVGAAPIQNIGAYGAELSTTCVEVEVFDRQEKKVKTLIKDQCDFSYRNSIFKKEKDKYIIINITLKLSNLPPSIPQYADVQKYFKSNAHPTQKQIRNVIMQIRNNKIPDYKQIPNCGSFFENPIITKEHLNKLTQKFPEMPYFELPNDFYKVFAGWLIEHVDFESAQTGGITFNHKSKLILLNSNNATFDDLQYTLSKIKKLIHDTYAIDLKIEPNIFD